MSALVLCLSHVGERKAYKVCELFLLLHDCQCSTECTLHGSQLRQAAKRVLLSTAHHKTSAKICTALRKHTGLKQPSRAERKLVLFSLSLSLSFTHTQVIPTVSSVPFYSTLIPLLFVLTVTAVKDAYDDIVSPLAVVGGGGGVY